MSDPSLRGLLGFHWWRGGKPAKASRGRLSGRRTVLPFVRIEMLESRAMMAVDIQTVYVGNVNNPADPATGYGSVDHAYRIGKFEVTLNQYSEFLNSVATVPTSPAIANLYKQDMAGDKVIGGTISRTGSGTAGDPYAYAPIGNGDRPVPWVTWFDAARMANWLHHGGTSTSSTEKGAYTLNGATEGIIPRNQSATWWIPRESEWYKAAYYDPTLNNGAGGYYAFPTKSNLQPVDEPNPPGATNSANYNSRRPEGEKLTVVGAYAGGASAYGTFDQGGNLWEWTNGVVDPSPSSSSPSSRVVRGGSWSLGLTAIGATHRRDYTPGFYEDDETGFRLATTAAAFDRPAIDLNGDGIGDTVWRKTDATGVTTGYVGRLCDAQGNVLGERRLSEGGGRVLETAAYFNTDSVTDLVWRNPTTNATVLWVMKADGTIATKQYLQGRNTPDVRVEASGDYDGNGCADLVWRHASTNAHEMWLMKGRTVLRQEPITVPSNSRLVATTADYDANGDGCVDLIWKDLVSNVHKVRLMSDKSTIGGFSVAKGTGWDLATTGNYDANHIGDLIWRNTATGSVVQWLMTYDAASGTGQHRKETEISPAGTPRTPVPSMSYAGNAIAWRRPADGTYALWKMLGLTAASKTSMIGGGATERLVRRLPQP
jgi:formylglycine-generating enzyme required for sulfatase activity